MNINSLRAFSGNRGMYKFAFRNFMKANDLTLESLAQEIGYSTGGVARMITRGTIKKSIFEMLSKKYSNMGKYRWSNDYIQ
jgi:hypothetical protein